MKSNGSQSYSRLLHAPTTAADYVEWLLHWPSPAQPVANVSSARDFEHSQWQLRFAERAAQGNLTLQASVAYLRVGLRRAPLTTRQICPEVQNENFRRPVRTRPDSGDYAAEYGLQKTERR